MKTPATPPLEAGSATQAPPAANTAEPTRRCAWCDAEFAIPRGPGGHKRFCCTDHRTAFGNREKAQGAVIVSVAKVWRRLRGAGPLGKAAFADLTAMLDLLNERDREDKLPKLDDYVRAVLRDAPVDRLDDRRVRARRLEKFRATMAARQSATLS